MYELQKLQDYIRQLAETENKKLFDSEGLQTSETRMPYIVVCPTHREVYLLVWKYPHCGSEASWNDVNYDEMMG